MKRLPVMRFREMERVLLHPGIETVRQKGSHVFYRHSDGRTTTVPNHPGLDLARPLVREILRKIEMSQEQFLEKLEHL